jgi:hypothetical protein
MINWPGVSAVFGFAGFSLKLASFIVGPRGRSQMKERLESFYLATVSDDWTAFPAYILRAFDAFLTSVLGKGLLSLRALSLGALPAAAIGFAAFSGFMALILPAAPESIRNTPRSSQIVATAAVAIGFGLCDSLLIALSRHVVRRGAGATKVGVALTLVVLYVLIVFPSVLTSVLAPLLNPDKYDWSGLPVALLTPILTPFYVLVGPASKSLAYLCVISVSLSPFLFFVMLTLGYVAIWTRRFTQAPLQWLLNQLESFDDTLSVAGELLAGAGLIVQIVGISKW